MKIQISTFLYLIILMCGSLNSWGQCSGASLNTQLEVDNWLSANSWNCTVIDGDLFIGSTNSSSSSDINDLSGFINFTEVTGDLIISNNDQLTNLNGFNNIQKVTSSFRIEQNPALINLEGFNALTEVYSEIFIGENESLINLSGLNNLQSNNAQLTIQNNSSLQDISALGNLEATFGQMEIAITNNDNLTSLNGLQNISLDGFFGGVRIIDNDALVNLQGLEGLGEVFYLYIEDNDNLLSLEGINNLLGVYDGLIIRNNDALLNLNGMEAQNYYGDPIMYFYGSIIIEDNEVLNDISGIQSYVNLTSDFIIRIKNNPNLSDCRSISICEYVDNGNIIMAENNAVGCNSNLEIETSCGNGSLNGQLTYDANDNCIMNSEDTLGLVGWKVFATSTNFTYFTFTDNEGFFEFDLIAGDYSISAIPPNDNWTPCIDSQVYTIVDETMISINLLSSYISNCPILNVEISTPLMRRCFTNQFTINWSNLGPPVANAYIEVTPHFLLSDFNSSVPFTINANGNLEFFLGDIEVGASGEFTFYGLLSCDAEFGEIICNTAEIFPNEPCPSMSSDWSGANIFIDGICENDANHFLIENKGQFDMSDSLEYRLYKNAELIESITYKLSVNEVLEIDIPADGDTYRLESDQETFHPEVSTPSFTIEGCRLVGESLTTGFFLSHPIEDYGEPFSRICNPVIGSYDPNDKQGLPLGYGVDHVIEKNQPIEYRIRFQNTGTDTAFNIVVLDTLSENFDLNSLELGATSHPFQFSIIEDRVLQFSFDNIMLPDSNINEPGSHGYFKYTVRQISDLPFGTSFENSASIYFDFNDPIKTNTTVHKIDIISIYDTLTVSLCEGEFYNGIMYNEDTFLYDDTLLQGVFEYIDVSQILVFETNEITIDTLIDEGSIYNGNVYFQDTTIQDTLTNVYGCDSVVISNIMIEPLIITVYDSLLVSLCEGDLYNGITYFQNAILYDTLYQGQFEYIDVTIISVFETNDITIDTLIDEGAIYNGNVYFQDTTIQDTLTNVYGCDSVVISNIMIQFLITTVYDSLLVSLCEGDLYNGITYFQNAILYDTLYQGQFEYIDVTLISVFETNEITIDTLLQIGMSYNGIIPLADTTIQEVFINEFGCDSIVIANITVQPVSTQNLVQSNATKIKVSPNPFKESITFQIFNTNEMRGRLVLFDVIGNLVTQQEFDEPIFDLNKIPDVEGTYLYKIILEDQRVFYGKVVKIE